MGRGLEKEAQSQSGLGKKIRSRFGSNKFDTISFRSGRSSKKVAAAAARAATSAAGSKKDVAEAAGEAAPVILLASAKVLFSLSVHRCRRSSPSYSPRLGEGAL